MQITLGSTAVQLLPERALYLPEYAVLVIADLHLGKVMHFRKAGLFVPAESAHKDYRVLHALMQQYRPEEVWFLGDLFHSDHNAEWRQLEAFVDAYDTVRFTLIRGNHDILHRDHYERLSMDVVPEVLELANLVFSHEPLETVPAGKINIAGHIHPGCVLRGLGRQSLRLPCFYWCNDLLLLPAFGALTGLKMMGQGSDVRLYAIASDRVLLL
jgi:DNA ligase-associated metallophosphoesterase